MSEAAQSTFVYVTYIRTAPEKLWAALTDAETMRTYWFGMRCASDWRVGSPWRLEFSDGRIADAGEILESEAPKKLVIKWRNEFRPELKAEGFSTCTMTIEALQGAAKLTVLHVIDVEKSKLVEAVSNGWPQVLSNLKSLLETGEVAYKR
jgi:uncharacterized protein YndB with AHSA1/START domain